MLSPRINFVLCVLLSLALNVLGLYAFASMLAPGRMFKEAKPSPAPRIEIFAPPTPPSDEIVIGKENGVGDAVNETILDDVQTALKSTNDQANQTRDPTGHQMADAPSPPVMQPTFAPPPAALPTPPLTQAMSATSYIKPQPQVAEQLQPTPTTPPTPPSTPSDAGRPAEHTDRDSDRFAKNTSVEFKDGKVTAQNGREIKFARPQRNLAAYWDGAIIPPPLDITFRIAVDVKGNVRNVEVVKSTGSRGLDRVLELTIYRSWFEPAKDESGNAVPTESEFTMTIE